ncbi:hypothetical protein ACQE3D_25500 (plasmid) [Methylomonas sp. MS20]|uniref:hypothetical protein n=1 Tax=Methylomonas sp. MS20 TaxID=3418769 RepID=UPI003D0923BD
MFEEKPLTVEEQRRRSAEWYGDAHHSDADYRPERRRRPAKPKAIAKPSRFSVPVAPVVAEIMRLKAQDGQNWRDTNCQICALTGKLRKMLRTRLYDGSITMEDFEAAAPLLAGWKFAPLADWKLDGLIAHSFHMYLFGRDKEIWEFASLRDAVLSLIERKHPSEYPASIAHRKVVEALGNVREPNCAFKKILWREYYPPLTAHEYRELMDDGCGATIAIAGTTQFLIACTETGLKEF